MTGVKPVTFANDAPLALIAGPCQLESLAHARMLSEKIAAVAEAARTPWVFKGSFDKANLLLAAGETGYPVVFDATHSVQLPGGQRRCRRRLRRGLYRDPRDPDNAPSDGPNWCPWTSSARCSARCAPSTRWRRRGEARRCPGRMALLGG